MNGVRIEPAAGPLNQVPGLGLPLACLWLLMLTTFSLPGRGTPPVESLDYVALAKLGSRCATCLLLGGMALSCWNVGRAQRVRWLAAPLCALVCWALISVAWSPIRSFSLGQAGGFAALVVLAVSLGCAWRGSQDTSLILRHLSLALLVCSGAVLLVAAIDFEASGLDRLGGVGLVHATSAGATASLGLLILLATRFLWGWPWSRAMLWPGLAVHGALLLMSNSRTALALTVLLVAAACLLLVSRQVRASLLLGLGLSGAIFLALDPGLEWLDSPAQAASEYLRRGQSANQVSSLTGRTELWGLMWDSFRESPLIGHGYFVCSRTGTLDVWGYTINHTAHNLLLQVLVSTGIVGGVLFVWGLARPWWPALGLRRGRPGQRRLASLLTLVACWYLGWGLLNESFMGPIQPESVVFYVVFGLALGSVAQGELQNPLGAL